ncbi:hypothetical protein JTB14_008908 [Gonioctena quinquepunctata]|nr:hypothetical protein JTB14_008908 [Gonioctena quinquepunctata]
MEWTNEKVINLINLYWDRPVLWDCRLKDYKDRNKKMDALLEIADQQTSDGNVEVTQEETQNVYQEPLEDSVVASGSGKKGSERQLFKSPSARSHSQKKHKNVDQEPLEDNDVASESGKKGSKRKLFKSPSARSHSQKKHKFSAT